MKKILLTLFGLAAVQTLAFAASKPSDIKDIKAYCLDFNWGSRRNLADPGSWKNASPEATVQWYKTMGANVIQTFCVSTNGYAWYKGGYVPEQPGLKADFLPEVVKLGHKEGMLVMGYFTIGCNPRWANEHPQLAYKMSNNSRYHIPYTDEYLDYLSKAVDDAVRKTGIDGFMIDWLWQPKRLSKEDNGWIDAEKALYKQLMGEEFPGETNLTKQQDIAYARKAIDRCWKTIRKAAKTANPDCIVWLTCNKIDDPTVVNSDMYQEVDWLMNEAGDMKGIDHVRPMVGKHTRLITCLASWNGKDATKIVPEALAAGIGLYGFAKPRDGAGTIPLGPILTKPLSELKGDDRSISMLARAYNGAKTEATWTPEKGFEEPK